MFQDELQELNLTLMVREIEGEIYEFNNFEWAWRYIPPQKMLPKIKELVNGVNFYEIGTGLIVTKAYWCGLLTAVPWCELEEQEETLCNELLHKNSEVVLEDDQIKIRFRMNESSLCHPIFVNYPDGYGGNIAYSYNNVLWKIKEPIHDFLKKQIPENTLYNRWGEWHQAVACQACHQITMIGPHDRNECPNCHQPLMEVA